MGRPLHTKPVTSSQLLFFFGFYKGVFLVVVFLYLKNILAIHVSLVWDDYCFFSWCFVLFFIFSW